MSPNALAHDDSVTPACPPDRTVQARNNTGYSLRTTRAPAPVSTQGAKGFTLGTHRAISPEDTLRTLEPLMPTMGITRIADVTGLDTIGVPVVMVTRPNARCLSVAQGKGLTLAAARASGLMESIESYHAENITAPLRLASSEQLGQIGTLIDVKRLPRYAGQDFHPEMRILWLEGENLLDGSSRWIPHAVVHTDFTVPHPAGSTIFVCSSSGLAGGNHIMEAISHALCELIERDAATLWHCAGPEAQQHTRVDLDTVTDPACLDILDRYRAAGISVMVWDMTSDVGIAAFQCGIIEEEPNLQRPIPPMGGMGCHPTREIALLRALTEAAQSRVTLVAGSRDDLLYHRPEPDTYLESWRTFQEQRNQTGPLRSFADAPSRPRDTFAQDIAWELIRLRAAGMNEVVAVDLTRPEFGVPVVRVIVPGLEILHDVPGYRPGPRARAVLFERFGQKEASS